MEQVTNPHDKFFKETFSREEVARYFVRHYFPERMVKMFFGADGADGTDDLLVGG